MDLSEPSDGGDWIKIDLTSDSSVAQAMRECRDRFDDHIASVVHLAAYFDFTGERKALYEQVNVEGTRRLLRALHGLKVEQFVYSGTVLVHQATSPGARIDESTPIRPRWAYPESKADAERVIAEEHGDIPYVLLHLAGLYDEQVAVPTLAQQIARIYERDFKSYLYAGDQNAGQSMIHKDDMVEAFRRTIDRRAQLPAELTVLVGEPDAMSYQELQEALGGLIHGEEWPTLSLPPPLAKAGAWLQSAAEPLVPDAIDHGEKPFIQPFMIEIASDHYALDIRRAHELLDWQPKHRIADTLPQLVAALKRDPPAWYRANGITPPAWLTAAEEEDTRPEKLRRQAKAEFRLSHRNNLAGPWSIAALGVWLIASPPTLGTVSSALVWSDIVSGACLLLFALLTLSWRLAWMRWLTAIVGLWILFAPLVFWTDNAAAYLNDTLVGTAAIALAVALPPTPGVSPVAESTGPTIPAGWQYSPSSWSERLPIMLLALIGLLVSRYMAAYQLGHANYVWEPLRRARAQERHRNHHHLQRVGSVAGFRCRLGRAGIHPGDRHRRYRFDTTLAHHAVAGDAVRIVPLGVVSITFIIIQPIVIGTWCTLCLIGAAAMVMQIPYSLDELVATGQFLLRRKRAGKNLLRVFFAGDTDDDDTDESRAADHAGRDSKQGEKLENGVNYPWNLLACIAIGLWLMTTRLTVSAEGSMANADHLIGSLVITVAVTALAEVWRKSRDRYGC